MDDNNKNKNSNNNKDHFEELAILNALGLLEKNEKQRFVSGLKDSDEAKKKVKEFNNLASLISQTYALTNKELTPSATVKDKLFEKINSLSEKKSAKKKEGFEFILADSFDWMPHPELEGIQIKRLAVNQDKGYLMLLMKAAAGAEYPSHHHSGAEECYVLEGDLIVEGKHLGPGDFHHAEGDSDHDPLRTENGVTLLLVVDPRDY